VLLVPEPLVKAHVVGMPEGSVPLKVTVPVAFVLYPESPLVTVAVHVSELPTVPVAGEQLTVVVVAV
jgi:hypothetical protein